MMEEQGLFIIYRWAFELSPKLNRDHWTYLYRAVDQNSNTIDFWLCKKRDMKASMSVYYLLTTKEKEETWNYLKKDYMITI